MDLLPRNPVFPEVLKGPGLLPRTVYIIQSQRKEKTMTISERTLRKWRKEALLVNKNIEEKLFQEVPILDLCYHILSLTQELLDRHLLQGRIGEFAHPNTINSPVDREQLMKKLTELEKGEKNETPLKSR